MVKNLNLIKVQKLLKEKNLEIFSPQDFQRLFKVTRFSASKFIHQYTKKNFFSKIKNGLYCLSSLNPSSFELANKIYEPSYISLETALAFYGIIPETTYSISSISCKATRSFTALDKKFNYHRIKKELFTGYFFKKQADEKFLIAEPEKAFFDYIYFTIRNKRNINDRLNFKKLKKAKVEKWQKLFNNQKINDLIKKLYDKQY
jgi:predicted transcriptional regulator of viral defense system